MLCLSPRSTWSPRKVHRSALEALGAVLVREPVAELGDPSDLKIAKSVGSVMPAACAALMTEAIAEPPPLAFCPLRRCHKRRCDSCRQDRRMFPRPGFG